MCTNIYIYIYQIHLTYIIYVLHINYANIDQEVGDGTTSVVIIAAELLKRANELVKNNIHPTV